MGRTADTTKSSRPSRCCTCFISSASSDHFSHSRLSSYPSSSARARHSAVGASSAGNQSSAAGRSVIRLLLLGRHVLDTVLGARQILEQIFEADVHFGGDRLGTPLSVPEHVRGIIH
jgi:hypothetical protein